LCWANLVDKELLSEPYDFPVFFRVFIFSRAKIGLDGYVLLICSAIVEASWGSSRISIPILYLK